MNDKPLLLIGGLARRERQRVRHFALRLGAPVYAEPLSGLREDAELEPLRLFNERMLSRAGFTRVIRIGSVPTVRFWRDLDEGQRHLPVVSYSALPFRGLSRGDMQPLDALPADPGRCDRDEELFTRDREFAARLRGLLDAEPQSELSMVRSVAEALPHGARVYLGNSLPIREWDLVAPRQSRDFVLEANRGANGIDGQLSTFFGWCAPAAQNVAIVGDLTAIYDMNAPWIVPQLDAAVRFRIVIVNNGGGRIFSRVPSLRRLPDPLRQRIIENQHSFSFVKWADMWNLNEHVTELRPDAEASARVWRRYDEMWS